MCELIAEENLRRQGFSAFNPQYEVTKVTRGRAVTTRMPYFGGYMLIHFDRTDHRWRSINGTRGVGKLMMADDSQPARIPHGVVEAVLAECGGSVIVNAAKVDRTLRRVIPVGAKVKLLEGAFADFEGDVTWSKGDRVKVLMSLFGRPSEVKMAMKDVVLA